MKATRIFLLIFSALGIRALSAEGEGKWDLPKDPAKFHIFIFMGQSNMAGGFRDSHLYDDDGNYDPVTAPVPRVLKWQGGDWKPAAHPLTKHNKTSFSIPLPFARKYLALLNDPDVKVGLVISAFGGKAIDHFTKGGRYHPSSARLKALKKVGTFKGIIWHQGESDTNRAYRYLTYERKLHGIIADLRSYVEDPGLPFVTGQISRTASNSDPEKEYWSEAIGVVARVLADIGDHVNRAAHVRSTGAASCTEHMRKLVDDDGKPTGQTRRMRADPIHFNRSGYTTMAHRYVNAILDRPSFKNDPVRIRAVPGRAFSSSLIREVSDISRDALTFTSSGAPAWLKIGRDGAVSGIAPATGTSTCRITVTDKSGAVDAVTLQIVTQNSGAPAFSADAFKRPGAIAGKAFQDGVRYDWAKSWSSEVHEPDGDKMTFSRVGGPNWLNVSRDGTFSGTPPAGAAGKTVTWTVQAADRDGSARAAYSMTILDGATAWVEGFDYYPAIKHKAVGPVLQFNADSPTDTWFIRHGNFPVNLPKACHDLHTALFGDMYKFSAGALQARAIVLDKRRFAAGKGRYRFRFNLLGVNVDDAHFIVSFYEVHPGHARGDGIAVDLYNKQIRGAAAAIKASGNAAAVKLAEQDYGKKDGSGIKDIYFEYGGKGHVLLVFSASRDNKERGGGSAFDDLSITAVETP